MTIIMLSDDDDDGDGDDDDKSLCHKSVVTIILVYGSGPSMII